MEIKIKNPIKIIPSENYLLMIKDADGITHYWHKEHISIIDGVEVKFENGQYDGWSRKIDGKSQLHWAIKLRKKLLINGSWAWNAWLRGWTGWLEINL